MENFDANDPAEALISLRESGRKTPKKTTEHETSKKRSHPHSSPEAIEDDDSCDEEDWRTSPSPQSMLPKKQKGSPSKTFPWGSIFTFAEKRTMKGLSASLNNLLKQSKARRWACFEWFYSDIDGTLFTGENDFSICLREHFPLLKARKLTRMQWSMIRRMMGKPRRCSAAFFAEERQALATKRKKIRYLLHRKSSDLPDFNSFKELPDEVALPIVIGTKVTARLREPQDGLFSGQVDAVDVQHNTYRITFDREGLGTRSVPDFEVASNGEHDTIPLSSLITKDRQRPPASTTSPPRLAPALHQDHLKGNSSLLTASPARLRLEEALKNVDSGGSYGGFPVKFLVLATRLSKILAVKKKCIKRLKDMNSRAERMDSYGEVFTRDFQKTYASIVLELERINQDLNTCLQGVQQYCRELDPDNWLAPFDQTTNMQAKCDREAQMLVETSERNVQSGHLKDLVSDLTSLLLQIKFFADNNLKSFELNSINQMTDKIKAKLDRRNTNIFIDKVEVHTAHIQNGLGKGGNVHAFKNNLPSFTNI